MRTIVSYGLLAFCSRRLQRKRSRAGRIRLALALSTFIIIAMAPLGDEKGQEPLVTSPWPAIAQAANAEYQGFGATTPGGSGGKVVHVTNLNDSGPGSLREAVSKGNRTVVFDVGGEIVLSDYVFVKGAFVTIDGFTAPPPGITLKNRGLIIRGTRGAHDVIVRGIRVRNSPIDGIQVSYGAYNVVIDHVSIHGSGDGNLDITDSHDVTVSWSILAEPAGSEKNMLIKYGPSRITLHHNIFVKARQRNPQVRIDDPGTPATDTTIDMRNNVVWDWDGGYGTLIWYGPWANIVDNFYSSAGGDAKDALTVCKGDCNGGDPASLARAYVAGNFSGDGLTTINDVGNEGIPFPAPLVDTLNACMAAHWVLSEAGVRPLDLLDQQYLSLISLPSCKDSTASPDLIVSSLSLPSKAGAGSTISVTDTIKNQGGGRAGAFTIKFYLSTNTTYGAGDILLGSRAISSLAPGATSSGSTFVSIPFGTTAGTYYIVGKADAEEVVLETNEGNNAKFKKFKYKATTIY